MKCMLSSYLINFVSINCEKINFDNKFLLLYLVRLMI